MGKLLNGNQSCQGLCKWMSTESCLNWLLEVKLCNDRVGPSVVFDLINDSLQSAAWKLPPTLHYQEYPPGVILVLMQSRTRKPFHTTTLVIFAPENVSDTSGDYSFVPHGDALIVDPGCRHEYHEKLKQIVACLPRKLIVFVTHHHRDHVKGLSIIQKYNPNATLLAHENTMRWIGKGDWSLGYTSVSREEDILVGGQRLTVIFAPSRKCCPGHYFWWKHDPKVTSSIGFEVKCYGLIGEHKRNRRSREASILKAIENGAETLFDIVANVYSGVDCSFWIAVASNVRLHADHHAQQKKLPKDFSVQNFIDSGYI